MTRTDLSSAETIQTLYIVKATKETKKIQALLEVGFESVYQKDSFRKRK